MTGVIDRLACRLFGHVYPDSYEFDATCRRCGRYQFDLSPCPECGHENSAVVWDGGVTCENCGWSI